MSGDNLKRKFPPIQTSTFNPAKKFKPFFAAKQDPNCSSFSNISSTTTAEPFHFQSESRSRKSSLTNPDPPRPKFKARPMPNFPAPVLNFSRSLTSTPTSFNAPSIHRTPSLQENFKFNTQSYPDFCQRNPQKSQDLIPQIRDSSVEHPEKTRSLNSTQTNLFKFEARPLPTFYSNCPQTWKKAENPEEKRGFTAKPMPDFSNVFVPIMTFEPTQAKEFELNSGKRAVERQKFDLLVKDKENYINELKLKQEIIQAEEIKSYRKTLEFKARPLSELKPFLVKRSEEELTKPRSPVLLTKCRAIFRELDENRMDLD